jgi:hypothetical protein
MSNKHLYAATLFGRALGKRVKRLARGVRRLHGVEDAAVVFGYADIDRGKSLSSRVVGRLFGFPPAGRAIPTAITVVSDNGLEIWHRRFAAHPIVTHLEPACDHARPTVVERFRYGVAFDLELNERAGALTFHVKAMRIAGIPMPRWLWPILKGEERSDKGRFVFDIDIALRLVGPLIHYRGWVRPGRVVKREMRSDVATPSVA